VSPCRLLRFRGRRHEFYVLADVQVQVQLIGNTDRDAIESLKHWGQTRFKAAADMAEMLDGQPRHPSRCVHQRPVQGAVLQGVEDFFGGVSLQVVLLLQVIQHGKVAHQKQPMDAHRLHPVDQRIDGKDLLDRSRDDGFFHMFVAHRQSWRIQQADHRRTAGDALLDPLGIEQVAGFGAQTRTRRQCRQVIENGDDLMLAPKHLSHQRTAKATHGTIEHQFDHRGFGVFHG
jgi:hypothetical protein